MPLVTLANKKTFPAAPDKTLLSEAKSNGLALEYSCRTGRCGTCKATVISGDTVPLQSEEALTAAELNDNVILTCCRAAVSDLILNISDLGRLAELETKTVPCRIDSLTNLAPDVMQVTLRLPPSTRFDYLAGQYIDVILNGTRRSYSLANSPRPDGKLLLQIRRVDQGVLSRYWFDKAQVNDLLRLEGPLGTFCLRSNAPSHFVFLATGTGIAPVNAMLEELAENPDELQGKSIRVYWGGRTTFDIYSRIACDFHDFNFVPVLSRPSRDWKGRTGYVQNALLEDNIELDNAIVYACGSDDMIHAARTALCRAGLPADMFYSDAFVSSD